MTYLDRRIAAVFYVWGAAHGLACGIVLVVLAVWLPICLGAWP